MKVNKSNQSVNAQGLLDSCSKNVDEAVDESFPASDPPAWTITGVTQKKDEIES